ncbi:MAG TPA: type IV pilin protein [Limnobacter sp.]|uniref:type IV pilin protein n=1 Tax=Limnobacter sp. TaxID=2003368 RepID=UPI002E30A795|nr:type IV pilin protein [Limnobacter sp.]HEX5486084.1 type IV pilin protein [Limnobacter sp.]
MGDTTGRSGGFSLLELMIATAIVAILAGFAYPSYTQSMTKNRRIAAASCLMEYSSYMEQFYATYLRYDKTSATGAVQTLPVLNCASNQQTGGTYTYAFAAGSLTQTTFKISATPVADQALKDRQCGALTIDQTGKRGDATGTVGGSANCW